MSIFSSSRKESGNKNPESEIQYKRSGWRSLANRCCCRNGFYPVVVAPIITGAWLLDIYCSAGCDFVRLDIGFEPMNEAWNQTSANLGFFLYDASGQNVADTSGNILLDTFHPSCRSYDSAFDSFFVDGDQTWTVRSETSFTSSFINSLMLLTFLSFLRMLNTKMSQIMAYVSGFAGLLATFFSWLMIVTSIPSCFTWTGVLLPSVLVSFLAGGAKFLLFDSEICRSALFVPVGGDLRLASAAESCRLGADSIVNIVATAMHLVSVLLVCLKTPDRRTLEETYGFYINDINGDMQGLRTDTMEDSLAGTISSKFEDPEAQTRRRRRRKNGNDECSVGSASAYNLESISSPQNSLDNEEGSKDIIDQVITTPSMTIKESNSYGSKSSIKDSNVFYSKTKDWDCERLREAEPSIEYTDRDLKNVLTSKLDTSSANDESTRCMSMVSYEKEPSITPSSKSSLMHKPVLQNKIPNRMAWVHPSSNKHRRASSTMSAPSDEGNFLFRSPKFLSPSKSRTSGKENASPQITPPRNLEKVATMKTLSVNNQSAKYDDDLINQVCSDLRKSFSVDSNIAL